MDAAIAALLGTGIGAVASFGAMWIQQKNQTRRDRLKVAADLGLADYKGQIELAKLQNKGAKLPPLSAYVMYHAEFLDALSDEEVTPEVIKRLNEKQAKLMDHYYDYKRDT
ncbi:MAG: hypothetical protein Q8K57_17170 [Thiobacillus sp.]|nr:hypothetical protein [Thiobacillus sp.]